MKLSKNNSTKVLRVVASGLMYKILRATTIINEEKMSIRNQKCSEHQDHLIRVFLRMMIKTLYSSAFF